MTTTEQLREYLDAHGIDGPPTDPGWYVVRADITVIALVRADAIVIAVVTAGTMGRLLYSIGTEDSGRYLWQSDIVRHAPLTTAPPLTP